MSNGSDPSKLINFKFSFCHVLDHTKNGQQISADVDLQELEMNILDIQQQISLLEQESDKLLETHNSLTATINMLDSSTNIDLIPKIKSFTMISLIFCTKKS